MKKYVLVASVVLVLGASPAYAQQSGELEVTIPGNPTPVVEQYDEDSGGETTTQSIEEGLEDAVEDVEPGAGNDAVVGTGSYVESLTGSEPVAPAEAAEPVAHDKPSDTYTELPDTGGLPLAGLGAFAVGGVMLLLRAIRHA